VNSSRAVLLGPKRRIDIGDDSELIQDAARMARAVQADHAKARRYFFMWALILAMWEDTIPSDVFARLAQTSPASFSQRQLVQRLTAAMQEGQAA
jgi:hypothetical protein